jgi:peptide/nickel transport system substrate-binding protein
MAIHRFKRLIGLFSLGLLAMLPASCGDEREGPIQIVAVGPPPRLADPRSGPLRPGDSLLLQSVAQGLVAFDSGGNVVAGLAERWNVSNDGLSYIFRIAPMNWADGSKVTAEQVARSLRRQIQGSSRNALRDSLGAVSEIVAMTDRVIEIRLSAPRPNLLSLLAQPEMAILRNGHGTGPFKFSHADGSVRLTRTIEDPETEESHDEQLVLSGKPAGEAVSAFRASKADLVVGGTFADLPLARRVERPRNALRFDPASGLFGLAPGGRGGRFGSEEWRQLLNRAIDRDSFIAALGVPGLSPRSTLLEAGLDGLPAPAPAAWSIGPVADRRGELAAEARNLLGTPGSDQPEIRVFLPEGPGADLLLRELNLDWSYLGLKTVRAASPGSADLVLIDEVAPSSSPAWFARRFRCAVAPTCDPEIDELLQSARAATVAAQRYALIAQAAALIDSKALFLPIAAPVRWALVGERVKTFSGNRFARHSLVGIDEAKGGQGAAR